jgi:5-methylcytosine-specific restriction protein A
VLVHHKQKLSNGGTNDYKNLQALCQLCHSSLHARQNDRWQNQQSKT